MATQPSLEDTVRDLIENGRAEGKREHDAIRANVEADKLDEPTEGWGRYEEITRESDMVMVEGWATGLEAGLLAVARAIDELKASGGGGGTGGRHQGGGGGGGGGAGAPGGDGGSVYSTVTMVPPELLDWVRQANPELAALYNPEADDDEHRGWLRQVGEWAAQSAVQMPASVTASLIASLGQ